MLISGEAEDIGEAKRQVSRQGFAKQLPALRGNIDSGQRDALVRVTIVATQKCRRQMLSGIESCMADKSCGTLPDWWAGAATARVRLHLRTAASASPVCHRADVLQHPEKQWFVAWANRSRKSRRPSSRTRSRSHRDGYDGLNRNHAARCPSLIQSFAAGNWERPNTRTSP